MWFHRAIERCFASLCEDSPVYGGSKVFRRASYKDYWEAGRSGAGLMKLLARGGGTGENLIITEVPEAFHVQSLKEALLGLGRPLDEPHLCYGNRLFATPPFLRSDPASPTFVNRFFAG